MNNRAQRRLTDIRYNPLGPIYNADSYRTDLYDYVNRRKQVFKFSEEIEIK